MVYRSLAARRTSARSRARVNRVRVQVIDPQQHYISVSQSTGETYHLTSGCHGWQCTCKGFQYTGMCKHLGQLERRSERENWEMGSIAPPIDCTGDPVQPAPQPQSEDDFEIDPVTAEIMAALSRSHRREVR